MKGCGLSEPCTAGKRQVYPAFRGAASHTLQFAGPIREYDRQKDCTEKQNFN